MAALRSTYPVQGIFYFIAHPQLWTKTLCPFILTLIFGVVSLVLCFVFLLPLQAHALINAHCPTWLAWLVSVVFVLLESAIIDVIFFAILVPIYQDALFDATLKARGMSRMFETRVPVSGLTLCCRGIGSGLVFVWVLVLAQIFVLIITAPLHLVPVVGTALACYINGWPACWGALIHYDLEFRGFSIAESRRYAWQHREEYCAFGVVAVALELVPLFNLIFMWTNIVGAALWIADEYERNERDIANQQQQQQQLGHNPYQALPYPSSYGQSNQSFLTSKQQEEQQQYWHGGSASILK
ncbi:hypothetical protein BC941DRAFT_446496 [Chlamydoabsidia padenii]|nr:hypothetical protein BC941DRAFT_446496 [Chlamydoabsidia padenii]